MRTLYTVRAAEFGCTAKIQVNFDFIPIVRLFQATLYCIILFCNLHPLSSGICIRDTFGESVTEF